MALAGTKQFPTKSQTQHRLQILKTRTMTPREAEVYPNIPMEFKRKKVFRNIPSKEQALSLNHGEMSLVGDLPPHQQVLLWEAHKAARQKSRQEGFE